MTKLRIQRLFPAQLIFDLTTVTAAFVADMEVRVVLMDLVRCAEFPLVEVALCTTVVSIGVVIILGRVFGAAVHLPEACMKVDLVETRDGS